LGRKQLQLQLQHYKGSLLCFNLGRKQLQLKAVAVEIVAVETVASTDCIASHSGDFPSDHFSSFMQQAFNFSLFKLRFFFFLIHVCIAFIKITSFFLSLKFSVGFCCRSIGR